MTLFATAFDVVVLARRVGVFLVVGYSSYARTAGRDLYERRRFGAAIVVVRHDDDGQIQFVDEPRSLTSSLS